jgi:hypothetical protein
LVELQRMANDPHLLGHALVNLGNIDDREAACKRDSVDGGAGTRCV